MKQEDIDDDIARGQNWVSLFFSTFVWVRSMSMDFSRIASRCERKRERGGEGGWKDMAAQFGRQFRLLEVPSISRIQTSALFGHEISMSPTDQRNCKKRQLCVRNASCCEKKTRSL